MAKTNEKPIDLSVIFVGLGADQAPRFAAYQLDSAGRAVKKIGTYDGKGLKLDLREAGSLALGPDIEDFKDLPKESLVSYRVSQKLDLWRKQGVVLPPHVWRRFIFDFICVTGTVRKCRPWFWNLLDDARLMPMFRQAQAARIKPITAELNPHIYFPISCQPICDGVVEIYERECCCIDIHIPDLLERLRDILDALPIPIPDPDPGPYRLPDPIPGSDPGPFAPQLMRSKARAIQQRKISLEPAAIPPENLYNDYLALRDMPVEAAQLYVSARPYLFPIFCHCSVRKVGQTSIQPGGYFDFCYLHIHNLPQLGHCFRTYSYKIKQLIDGVLTVVYDGLAANQYFSAAEPADIRSYNSLARVCAEGAGDAPPNDGLPFVMLEHIGQYGSFHFNYPDQTDVSQVGMLDADDGSYTTHYAPDCPWGGALGLRLWFSPELEPTVSYYRLKVFAVSDAGMPVGAPMVLNDTVTWDKLVDIPGDLIRAPENLGPTSVGPEHDLFRVPYWSSPDHRYLSGQYHQLWNTAQARFPDGKYMLIIEVFDAAGNRIKPNGSAGPGTGQSFQFRRWASAVDTDPVPFADVAHVFWIDNTPVVGDIVDLRQDSGANTAECQFMSGSESSTFAIGFKAYHIHGVEHAGSGDNNSFMQRYDISWQRGLNGATGSLGYAPSGGNNHTDVGESGGAVSSGTQSFGNMLGSHPKCTFSVTLHVSAKHFNGRARIRDYDYWETASFALEII